MGHVSTIYECAPAPSPNPVGGKENLIFPKAIAAYFHLSTTVGMNGRVMVALPRNTMNTTDRQTVETM